MHTQEDSSVRRRHVAARVDALLRQLAPREEQVLRARFGIEDHRHRTCKTPARRVGVRADRIEARALRKLWEMSIGFHGEVTREPH